MGALTVKQPWALLIMAGVKDVENRTWPPPKTLPQWWRCPVCTDRGRWEFTATDPPVCVGRHAELDMVPDGPYPFRLWVHAGLGHDHMACLRHAEDVWNEPAVFGALLGSVLVTGCHHADECRKSHKPGRYPEAGWLWDHCSEWAEPDVWHWSLTDPRPLPEPIPMKGRQRLWPLPDDVAVPA